MLPRALNEEPGGSVQLTFPLAPVRYSILSGAICQCLKLAALMEIEGREYAIEAYVCRIVRTDEVARICHSISPCIKVCTASPTTLAAVVEQAQDEQEQVEEIEIEADGPGNRLIGLEMLHDPRSVVEHVAAEDQDAAD